MQTLSLIVNDEQGVLLRVVGVFSRFKLNIDYLEAKAADDQGLFHITIKLECDDATTARIATQILKLIDVLEVKNNVSKESIDISN